MARTIRPNTRKKRKRRGIITINECSLYDECNECFEIDENDYRIIENIMMEVSEDALLEFAPDDLYDTYFYFDDSPKVRSMIEIEEDDEECRVYAFDAPPFLRSLPESILELDALEELSFCNASQIPSWLASLPTSICNLAKLRVLDLTDTKNLKTLPDDIGNLTNLEILYLGASAITSLPTSICNLANLKMLDLTNTENLKTLPGDIGNLTNLEMLNLGFLAITSLPTSICNLAKLKVLDLTHTKNLKALPKPDGALTNLEVLELQYSGIVASLPVVIERHKDDADDLESIADIHSLPVSSTNWEYIKNLKNLRVLNFDRRGSILRGNGLTQKIVLELVLQLPLLGCIGPVIKCAENNCIIRALSSNRARSRICHTNMTKCDQVSLPSSLWPLLLTNAEFAVAHTLRKELDFIRYSLDLCQSDAIFQLLVDYGPTMLS
jgi:hypothetical protein